MLYRLGMLFGEFKLRETTGEDIYQAIVLYQNLHSIFQDYGYILADLSLMSDEMRTFKTLKTSQLLTVDDISSPTVSTIAELECVRQDSGIYSREPFTESTTPNERSTRKKGPRPSN